jgi:hypothetical protein
MNGAEHFTEAELLLVQATEDLSAATLASAAGKTTEAEVYEQVAAMYLAGAQVHATLALASVTAWKGVADLHTGEYGAGRDATS